MAIHVKPADTSAAKFQRRASAAGEDYKAGVNNPKRPQLEAAIAAAPAWAAGLQQAIADNRFVKGLNHAGPTKWKEHSTGKGALRYPQGVATAGPAWQKNTTPYLVAISNLTLPTKGPKGDPGNFARSSVVGTALHALKLSIKTAPA